MVTLSSLQTETDNCANSVEPDETARDELSHQDLHCLPFCFITIIIIIIIIIFII